MSWQAVESCLFCFKLKEYMILVCLSQMLVLFKLCIPVLYLVPSSASSV